MRQFLIEYYWLWIIAIVAFSGFWAFFIEPKGSTGPK